MSEDKKKPVEKLLVEVKGSAHKLWLASLGVYSRVEKLRQKGVEYIDTLAQEGEEVQGNLSLKVEEVKDQVNTKAIKPVEARVKKVVKPAKEHAEHELEELTEKIDGLIVAVKALSAQKDVVATKTVSESLKPVSQKSTSKKATA